MVQQSVAIGAAMIKPYDYVKAQIIGPLAHLATASVTSITTRADVDDPAGTKIQGSTTYLVRVAFVGLSEDGGLALTTLSNDISITTSASATGIKVTETIPAYALGMAVFIDGALAHIMPQKPKNRMNQTSCSREACVYYTATGNAMTEAAATAYAAAHVCYGAVRNDYPDTTGATTLTFTPTNVTVSPGHSSDFQVVTGKSPSAKGAFYKYDTNLISEATGSLKTTEGAEDIMIYGFRGSAVPKGRPFELITPSITTGQMSYFFMSAEMMTEAFSFNYDKAGAPNASVTIKEIPDEINTEVPCFFVEPWA